MKNPTEELIGYILSSLRSWDISLALNMTYFFTRHSERSEESHRRTDRVYTLLTSVVGYFAYAQYDVKTQVGYFAYAQYDVKLRDKKFFKIYKNRR